MYRCLSKGEISRQKWSVEWRNIRGVQSVSQRRLKYWHYPCPIYESYRFSLSERNANSDGDCTRVFYTNLVIYQAMSAPLLQFRLTWLFSTGIPGSSLLRNP